MGNESSYIVLALKTWNTQIDRADKPFGGFSSEEILREIAPGRNRLLYLWGLLTAVHDAMLPLLLLGERLHPEFDVLFVSNPTNREPRFRRTRKFARHGTASMLNCERGLTVCLGPIGAKSTWSYRKRILPKTLRAIASPSY
jgi:hypothetical protein